jgi:hypothetical protein
MHPCVRRVLLLALGHFDHSPLKFHFVAKVLRFDGIFASFRIRAMTAIHREGGGAPFHHAALIDSRRVIGRGDAQLFGFFDWPLLESGNRTHTRY